MTKFLAGIAVTIVIIVVALSAFYFGTKYTLQTPVSVFTPIVTPTPGQMAIIPTPSPQSTKIISAGGILSFPKYRLTVPLTWSDTKETSGQDMEKLILKKPGYEISVTEGGFGGAKCLFPGDADFEGPSSRYDQFVDLTTKAGNFFRRVGNFATGKFSICEKTQYGWGSPASYGHISITTPAKPAPADITELDAILSSFER